MSSYQHSDPGVHRFGSAAGFSLGVEEELLSVDPSRMRLCDPPAGRFPRVSCDGMVVEELSRSMVELVTPVLGRADEAREVLATLRDRVVRCGATLLGAGLHPDGAFGDVRHSSSRRYREISESMGGVMGRRPACGVHVHVGMPDPETTIRACNGMRKWVPLLQGQRRGSPARSSRGRRYRRPAGDALQRDASAQSHRQPDPPLQGGVTMYNDLQLLPWLDAVRDAGGGFELFDAHVHFGISDPSGLLATEEEALAALELIDSGGLVFPLKEPDGYRHPNERALAMARDSDGRIAALARLDPGDDPTGEARRCLDAGAAGIKLHPRGEGFELADPRLDGALALADERRGLVMLHAGEGFEGLGQQALDRARMHPGARFVLAHCAISDLSWIWSPAAELPNVFFDTSWWNPSDLYALFRLVPPSRILYASDVPFASPVQSAITTARIALEAGLDQRQLRSVMGGQLRRLVAAEEPLDVGALDAVERPIPPLIERVYVALIAAVEGLLRGESPGQGLELARNGCKVADDHELAGVLNAVDQLLEHSEQTENRDPLRHGRAPGFDLVLIAAVAARTPTVAVPAAAEQ